MISRSHIRMWLYIGCEGLGVNGLGLIFLLLCLVDRSP